MIRFARLGFVAGAFFFSAPRLAPAQVINPPGSEVPIPPKPKTDTVATKVNADTIKAAFGRGIGPRTADIGPQYSWNRAELFATGALTVADLLERVPWATSFRTGWLASPKFVAVNGDMSRIKIFYDGIELDNLDGRSGSVLDLNTVQLWTLENVSIERFANEIRVSLRSWLSAPASQTDTNLICEALDRDILE
ncbi:MAG TPA: Plug domain-containing protein, partial [Gemmatimonadaceae bacterium]|nr:Plug domain-containing protein [Gemmatimonadaceae bacterium]